MKPNDYVLDHGMTGWSDVDATEVTVTFSNGNTETSDVVVFADGVNSLARATLLPGATPPICRVCGVARHGARN